MTARQRMVLVFVRAGDTVLVVRRTDGLYAGRWTTVAGDVAAGESTAAAARRAVEQELPGAVGIELVRGGLHVDVTDTVRRRTFAVRFYPFLFELQPGAPIPSPPGARWARPDELILAGALGETLPDLDETLARVWDPPAALPPLFRAEARLLASAGEASRVLARRAVALVARGAPPERVAALRPGLARFVNAARAAAVADRDVAGDLEAAARAEARAVTSAAEGAERPAAIGPVPEPRGRSLGAPDERSDLIFLAAEAVLPRGEIIAHAGALAAARAARGPVVACADAWAAWDDDLPPSLEPGLELVPRELVTRVIGSSN